MVKEALEKAKRCKNYNIFTSLNEESALHRAKEIDEKIARGEDAGRLAGVPYALKDNFLSKEGNTTASSKILEPLRAPLDSTTVEKLEAEGAIMIGRTNMDSFAHGSSTENSYFGPTLNAYDKERVAGGSSGGSAVAVAKGIVQFATGTDTGGSIRQPASFNGVYGFKPTYGTISRYGVVAMASSTDCIGFFARSASDIDLLMSVCAGQDPKDLTTLPDYYNEKNDKEIKKIGIIKDFDLSKVDPAIKTAFDNKVAELKKDGHEVVELSMPALKYALAVYYIVVPAEITSNLSRHDGIRYGYRSEDAKSLDDVFSMSRGAGFMPENKRRIMIGNFVLSSGFYDAYYLKAQKARTLIIDEYKKAFEKCDFILTPVSPNPAFKLGEKVGDPVSMYLEDVMSVPLNLAGVPGLAIPAGETESGLPVGLQIVGPRRSDKALLEFAGKIAGEAKINEEVE
ncbi:Asp-tRNA(Asn)/Glu-tRNA(Gln) amidotransferase subunit GatA [Candidatus Saccharibacteria bacterium]|nr:Asp-tRNA(Asn)/Glu-tRNA(Gln) amidotransferase subunit GatA [Candidatus Saccharibacteria bacterium]